MIALALGNGRPTEKLFRIKSSGVNSSLEYGSVTSRSSLLGSQNAMAKKDRQHA